MQHVSKEQIAEALEHGIVPSEELMSVLSELSDGQLDKLQAEINSYFITGKMSDYVSLVLDVMIVGEDETTNNAACLA